MIVGEMLCDENDGSSTLSACRKATREEHAPMRSGEFHGLVPAQLDELDRKLVRLLQEDGRRSVTEMAGAVGLSHAAVRQRIQRLLNERVVTIGAMTHPQTHGYAQSALVGVRVDHRVHEVSDAISAIDEVYYLVTTTGHYDLMAELMAADNEHLLDLVMSIRAIPGVTETETISFVDTVKWIYRPDFATRGKN
jgi:Lrp/AsnC family transcriptional regulator for asnA, asnC and gidA